MKTCVDWLRFRTRSNPFECLEAMRPMFGAGVGDLVELRTGIKAQDGWKWGAEFVIGGDVTVGRVDYGGESQRGWVRVNLTGEGCSWVDDWTEAQRLGDVLQEAEIRRLDVCLTTYNGEVSHERVIEAHARGRFSSGGRQPHYRVIGGSDPRAGRTIYVGKREGSDKMLRCYEKGFELLQIVPESLRDHVTHIEGKEVGNIYRVECEFKAETKFIPWSAIGERDQVFAGAYPFCAELLPDVEDVRKLQTLPDFKPRADLETALDHCRRAYGGIIRAALMAHNGDGSKVLERLASVEPSRALIEAGILTCDHL